MRDKQKTPAWRRYLRFWGSDLSADVDEELRFHLDMHVAEYLKRGMGAEEARRKALERFGNIHRAREQTLDIDRRQMRSEHRASAVAEFRQDLAYGGRMLRRQWMPTLVAIICLALGVAGTTAMFSVGHTMLVRPLPYPAGDRLVSIRSGERNPGVTSFPDYADLRSRQRSFTDVGASSYQDFTLLGGEPTRIVGAVVTASVFRTLGVTTEAGRLFTEEEDKPGAPKVAVVSHGFAMRWLGGVSRAVGSTITLGAGKHTVIGVVDERSRYPESAELWVPLAKDAARENRGTRWLSVVAALRPGVEINAARRDLRDVVASIARDVGADSDHVVTFPVSGLRDRFVAAARPALIALALATTLVLLVACANVAGLQLARTTSRAREIAVRAALGASRARLLRQLLTESVLLAVVGGVLGSVLAIWGTRALGAAVARAAPAWMSFRLDARALLFTLVVSAAAGIVFGAAPALRLARLDASNALRGGRALGPSRAGLQRAFVIIEMALCLVLLVAAGFALESVYRLSHVPLGFDPAGVATFRISLQGPRYDSSKNRAATIAELANRVGALPGVDAAGAVTRIPVVGCCSQFGTTIEGAPPNPDLMVTGNMVTAGYFDAMRIPLIRGRVFADGDGPDAPHVGIINETFAKRFWPTGSALGHRFDTGSGWVTIVGVVGDVKQNALDDAPEPQFYRPHRQEPWEDMWFAIRVRGDDPTRVIRDVRRILREVDPTQPVFSAGTMARLIDGGLSSERTLGRLLAAFALVALLLAMAGVYAVMSFVVSQRMPELGLRMALGADRRRVLRLVLSQGAAVAVVGAVIGLAGAIAAARTLAHSLYGVHALEPAVYAVAVAALVLTALIATLAPARRASAVDPMIALRVD